MVLAVGCGVFAALLLALYAADVQAQAASGRQEALAQYGGAQVEVFVATRDIAAGETLDAQNVSVQRWLADLLPAGALIDQAQVLGKTVAVPLLKNEPVVAAKLGEGAAPVTVPDGLCAVSVPAEDVRAVGGAITAGDEVHVYAADGSSVVLLGHDILVLETSNGARSTTQGSGLFGTSTSRAALTWVTLAVTPQQVQEVIAASRDKRLYLVLSGGEIDPALLAAPTGAAGDGQETDAGPTEQSAAQPTEQLAAQAPATTAGSGDSGTVDGTQSRDDQDSASGEATDAVQAR
jgi:pilus assembly protein CpaB